MKQPETADQTELVTRTADAPPTKCRHRKTERRYFGMEAIVEFCLRCPARRFVALHYTVPKSQVDRGWALPQKAAVQP